MSDIELIAMYNFERRNAEQYPEDERYGESFMRISVPRLPETVEDFNEVTKAIFRNGEFNQVALMQIFHYDENLFSKLVEAHEKVDNSYVIDQAGEAGVLDQPETIVGEVVDDK